MILTAQQSFGEQGSVRGAPWRRKCTSKASLAGDWQARSGQLRGWSDDQRCYRDWQFAGVEMLQGQARFD